MTPAARERLDNYLQRLRSTRTVVADEVEQSVREHIEIALAQAQAPVGATEVIGIPTASAPPSAGWWTKSGRSGAARSTGSAPAPSTRASPISPSACSSPIVLLPMFGFLLLIPAMFVGCAWIELAREHGEPLGAHRWLVYPAMLVVPAFATGLLIIAPPLAGMSFALDGDGGRSFDIPASRAGELRFLAGLNAVVFGSWWIIAGGFCAALVRPIRFVFAPLLDGLRYSPPSARSSRPPEPRSSTNATDTDDRRPRGGHDASPNVLEAPP